MTDDEVWTSLLVLVGDPGRVEVFEQVDRQVPPDANPCVRYVVTVPGMPDPEYGGQDFATYVSREIAIRFLAAGAGWMGEPDEDPRRVE